MYSALATLALLKMFIYVAGDQCHPLFSWYEFLTSVGRVLSEKLVVDRETDIQNTPAVANLHKPALFFLRRTNRLLL
jgi:hypothetical protein